MSQRNQVRRRGGRERAHGRVIQLQVQGTTDTRHLVGSQEKERWERGRSDEALVFGLSPVLTLHESLSRFSDGHGPHPRCAVAEPTRSEVQRGRPEFLTPRTPPPFV